jgi:hypothetical protein
LKKINDVAFRIELPISAHNVFHISSLRKYYRADDIFRIRASDSKKQPLFHKKGEAVWEFESILEHLRDPKTNEIGFWVKYAGHPPCFEKRSLLLEDVPTLVQEFEAANPPPWPNSTRRRGRRNF